MNFNFLIWIKYISITTKYLLKNYQYFKINVNFFSILNFFLLKLIEIAFSLCRLQLIRLTSIKITFTTLLFSFFSFFFLTS